MKKKKIILLTFISVIVLAVMFQDTLIKSYVSLCNKPLEVYAVNMLDGAEKQTDRYGIWKTSSYPEDNMVQFWTGAFGLAPSSTYKGFYYSKDNTHKVFSAADSSIAPLEINGDHATWTDGTDNHGSSTRIIDKWFWFEASF